MVTQKMTIRLDESELPEIRMVSGDVGREIQIEVYVREDSTNPIDLETYSAEITLIKPDNTFIMDNFTVDKYELPENAGAVSGYGYYQIKIFTAGSHQIYTGQGRFLVDDMILSDDVIESSSIAFGDRFPEDFATKTWVDDEIEAAGIGTYVAGNPAGEETMPPLVRLQINDDIYPISHKIEEMEDADITSPAAGDVLTYDADNQKWKNEPIDIPDPTVTKTATGNPIEITDGADAPLVKCVTQITGYQSGSGTPSPDNIRPIVAYTEGKIEVIGRNLLNKTTNVVGKYLGIDGVERTDVNFNYTDLISVGESITISGKSGYAQNANRRIHGYNSLGTWVEQIDVIEGAFPLGNAYSRSITIPSGISFIKFSYPKDDAEVQIERGDTAHAYEPYVALTTHTTTYHTSIYRGSEDCVNGTVTTEWGVIASYAGETLPGEWISDRDEYAPGTTPTTGAQVAYKLATPTTASIVVSNYPIKSLSGYNHIESSTGDMEVEYITQQFEPLMPCHFYSTAEHVVGKWVDGSDVKEKTYIFTGTGAANPFTTTIDFTGKSIIDVIPHYAKYTYGGGTVGYCAGSKLTESNSAVLKVEYDEATPPTVNVTSYLGSSTETYEIAFTIRYI